MSLASGSVSRAAQRAAPSETPEGDIHLATTTHIVAEGLVLELLHVGGKLRACGHFGVANAARVQLRVQRLLRNST